jgi:hypothetical protein
MDPRHDPRKIRERRDAARTAKEDRRAARGRERQKTILADVEGAFCAEALGAGAGVEKDTISLLRDYLKKGLPLSSRARELADKRLDEGGITPEEVLELRRDFLAGAVGLLKGPAKGIAYNILETHGLDLTDLTREDLTNQICSLLDQALGRGLYARYYR